MSTSYEALTPELRLALRAACEVADPVERGRCRAALWTGRLSAGLGALAAGVALFDVVLLAGG